MNRLLKAYIYGILMLIGWVGLSYLVSSALPISSDELAISILLNMIQLDGLLFGFSAVMFGFIFTREGVKMSRKHIFGITTLAFASFMCYIVSLAIDFVLLAIPEVRYMALFSGFVAASGVVMSSLYMLIVLLEKPLSG